jgi:hypothetical protein
MLIFYQMIKRLNNQGRSPVYSWDSLGYPSFYNLMNFLISLCVFTFNYSNNIYLAILNKFICQKINKDTKDKQIII